MPIAATRASAGRLPSLPADHDNPTTTSATMPTTDSGISAQLTASTSTTAASHTGGAPSVGHCATSASIIPRTITSRSAHCPRVQARQSRFIGCAPGAAAHDGPAGAARRRGCPGRARPPPDSHRGSSAVRSWSRSVRRRRHARSATWASVPSVASACACSGMVSTTSTGRPRRCSETVATPTASDIRGESTITTVPAVAPKRSRSVASSRRRAGRTPASRPRTRRR